VCAHPAEGLSHLLPPISRHILHSSGNEAGLRWHLRILSGVVQRGGTHLLPFMDTVKQCCDVGLAHDSRKVRKQAGRVLRHTLAALSRFYVREMRCLPPAEWTRCVCVRDCCVTRCSPVIVAGVC
jgi:hypothetical protein